MEIKIIAGVPTDDAMNFRDMLVDMFQKFTGGEVVEDREDPKAKYVRCQQDFPAIASQIGAHRLVRISPFDAQNRRHTSFVLVSVDGTSKDEMQAVSYVLHPFKMAKNHITEDETDDVDYVLAGHPIGIK